MVNSLHSPKSSNTSSCLTSHFVKKIKYRLICPFFLLLLAAERWSRTEWNTHSSFLQACKRAAKSLTCTTDLLPCFPPEDRNLGFPLALLRHVSLCLLLSFLLNRDLLTVSCPGGIYQSSFKGNIALFMQRKFSSVGQRQLY